MMFLKGHLEFGCVRDTTAVSRSAVSLRISDTTAVSRSVVSLGVSEILQQCSAVSLGVSKVLQQCSAVYQRHYSSVVGTELLSGSRAMSLCVSEILQQCSRALSLGVYSSTVGLQRRCAQTVCAYGTRRCTKPLRCKAKSGSVTEYPTGTKRLSDTDWLKSLLASSQ